MVSIFRIFTSRREADPVPPQPKTMNRRQFKAMFRSTQSRIREYNNTVGLLPAQQAMDDMFTQQVGRIPVGGNWRYGAVPVNPHSADLRFADQAAIVTFLNTLNLMVGNDIRRIGERIQYARGLKTEAANGRLYTRLQNDQEPLNSYYRPRLPARRGAPALPPRRHNDDYYKAMAWLTWGVQGATRPFWTNFERLHKLDGTNPFGPDDTLLRGAWTQMVTNPPALRGWNAASLMVPYPSNIGGAAAVNWILGDLDNNVTLPAQGNTLWYDYALYLFGSIVSAQGFTDGNKRAGRMAYALMLLSGAVPFIAPKNNLGAELAAMNG